MGIATDAGLKWAVLTSKRAGLNRDVPPGQEQWMWVARRSIGLKGTLSISPTFPPFSNWTCGRSRKCRALHLYYPWTCRPFLRPRAAARALPARKGARGTRGRQGNASRSYCLHRSTAFGASAFLAKSPNAW